MYGFLAQRIGHRAAIVITTLWFTALLLGIGYFAFEPQAELKYLAL